ncbi:DUF2087 domain-containing protein [Paenibacillus sp. GCM10027629]|uniref:DUF2087 domain-containing protein n=1 Tax=Paenibacillus sp. GCM10027629 TaxID=3273414 RepID=UPI003640DFEC
MSEVNELFWSATVEQLKQGYVYDAAQDQYICLVCGEAFTTGIIYTDEGVMYEAKKFAQVHVARQHDSMFDVLIGMDKKLTGLTDLQKDLVQRFYDGMNDNEIVKEQGGSASTIRNHRFSMREKMKQARIFLAIMEMAEAKGGAERPKFMAVPRTATSLDERYAITEQEHESIINKYFPDGTDGKLTEFPRKEKRKMSILMHLMQRFERNRKYTEHEVNEVLKTASDDFVTLRRYLIEYSFLDRLEDGSSYWVKVQ